MSRYDALLRQLHRPLRPCLRLLRALALQVALAPYVPYPYELQCKTLKCYD